MSKNKKKNSKREHMNYSNYNADEHYIGTYDNPTLTSN